MGCGCDCWYLQLLILNSHKLYFSQSAQRKEDEKIVRIPMLGGTDSLNLAVAGSLLLYAVFRSTNA